MYQKKKKPRAVCNPPPPFPETCTARRQQVVVLTVTEQKGNQIQQEQGLLSVQWQMWKMFSSIIRNDEKY